MAREQETVCTVASALLAPRGIRKIIWRRSCDARPPTPAFPPGRWQQILVACKATRPRVSAAAHTHGALQPCIISSGLQVCFEAILPQLVGVRAQEKSRETSPNAKKLVV